MSIQEKAFPNPHLTHETGMTIRDYFAAKAMQALLSIPEVDMTHNGYATWAYRQADAMMEARK
jgi:hypothetical protein